MAELCNGSCAVSVQSRVGAEQGLRVEAPAGVAQQHPADRLDRHAGMRQTAVSEQI
jgi:hypothetical protein